MQTRPFCRHGVAAAESREAANKRCEGKRVVFRLWAQTSERKTGGIINSLREICYVVIMICGFILYFRASVASPFPKKENNKRFKITGGEEKYSVWHSCHTSLQYATRMKLDLVISSLLNLVAQGYCIAIQPHASGVLLKKRFVGAQPKIDFAVRGHFRIQPPGGRMLVMGLRCRLPVVILVYVDSDQVP